MKEERSICDICNDINDILEKYEIDKKYIDYKIINILKEELFTALNEEKCKDIRVDNSFICLTLHLYKSVNDDRNIDWEHIGIYNELYEVIDNVFPNIEYSNITNMTYKKLYSSNIKTYRKI